MSSIDEIKDARIKKLQLLKERGVNPYPAESKRELYLKEAKKAKVTDFNDSAKPFFKSSYRS